MAELNRRMGAAVAATIVTAGLAAGGGGGDGAEAQGKLGGKAVATDGQRVQVIKMLEDITDPNALSVQGEVCGKNTTAGRFFVEVNHRRGGGVDGAAGLAGLRRPRLAGRV